MIVENEPVAECVVFYTGLPSLCFSARRCIKWVFYKISHNSNGTPTLPRDARRCWERCRCLEKGGKKSAKGPHFIWMHTSCKFSHFKCWPFDFFTVIIFFLFIFLVLNTRAVSSTVWQMVPFRCDYGCVVWGWGSVRVINAHTMIYRTAKFTETSIHACMVQGTDGGFARTGVRPIKSSCL